MKTLELKPGARAMVDGQLVTVRAAFPEGSTSYAFAHYKVDFDNGDRNVAISGDRVRSWGVR
jgi:hypothetical protein